MSFIKDFKQFIARGNLMDLAVGIMIGGAFKSIVSSLVDDILTPIISVFLGKGSLSTWSYEFVVPLVGGDTQTVNLAYGKFIQASIDFIILALVIFMIVKLFNNMKKKAEDPKDPEVQTPADIKLLSEILESLKKIEPNKIETNHNEGRN